MKPELIISERQADELLKRYYDGLTTDEEERLLRIFLASDRAAADERYRADRAVMGLAVYGRRLHQKKRPVRLRPLRVAAVVAGLVVGAGVVGHLLQNNDVCVAYINGQKYTDREMVMARMRQTLCAATTPADEIPSVEEQLQAVFDIGGMNGKN